LALLTTPCFAHHGVAPHYDDSKIVSLDGTVSEFQFINPHAFVYLRVTTNGQDAIWHCEMASRSVLERNGLTAQMFAPGKHVHIEGSQARQNPTGCALREAHFDDGSVLRASTLFSGTPAKTPVPEAQSNAVEGVWAMKRFTVSRYSGDLTEEGERRRAAFDPVKDDPAIYCDPASPVRFWVNVNEPFEIRRDGDDVLILHRFMDAKRVVHFDGRPAPANVPRSTMGYTTGHFDGKALVASTDHFVAATLEPRAPGVMHTENLKLKERLEVNRETGDLEITWTIDDPAYFKSPVTQKELYVRSPWDPAPYDCKPGYR
jgi:hypothetical protein